MRCLKKNKFFKKGFQKLNCIMKRMLQIHITTFEYDVNCAMCIHL